MGSEVEECDNHEAVMRDKNSIQLLLYIKSLSYNVESRKEKAARNVQRFQETYCI